MIDDILPEWFSNWWWRRSVFIRAVLAVPLYVLIVVFGILMFLSVITWLPLVAVFCELVSIGREERH